MFTKPGSERAAQSAHARAPSPPPRRRARNHCRHCLGPREARSKAKDCEKLPPPSINQVRQTVWGMLFLKIQKNRTDSQWGRVGMCGTATLPGRGLTCLLPETCLEGGRTGDFPRHSPWLSELLPFNGWLHSLPLSPKARQGAWYGSAHL
jgi:hypothetical protein